MEWTFRGLAQDRGGGDNVEGIVAPLTFSCLQSEVPDSSKALLSAPASLSVWPPFVSLHWDPYNWILSCKGENMSCEKTLFFLLDSMVRMQERIEGNSHLFHQVFWMGKPFSNATNAGYSPSWCPWEVLVYNLCPSVTTQSCPNLWQNTEVSGQPKASGANIITPGAPPKVPADLGGWPGGGCHPLFLPLQTRFCYCQPSFFLNISSHPVINPQVPTFNRL